jgi:hypothetical protein
MQADDTDQAMEAERFRAAAARDVGVAPPGGLRFARK